MTTLALIVTGLAFVVGLAIQQGSVCAVIAVEEIVRDRRADRFLAFLECALWAMLTIWLASTAVMIPSWSPLAWLCVGAVIFGIGAAVNGACAFGTIAWLGSGKLDFLLTGIAAWTCFYLVELFASPLLPPARPEDLAVSPWTPLIVALALPALMGLRYWLRPRSKGKFFRLSLAMISIGVFGIILAILHHPWPWMTILRQDFGGDALTYWILGALVIGAIGGGMLTGHFRLRRPTASDLRDRLLGGALMGVGGAMIPGGNDALILYGLPSASIAPFFGYMIMLVTIGTTLVFVRDLEPFWKQKPADL